jgi:hypothetical protein
MPEREFGQRMLQKLSSEPAHVRFEHRRAMKAAHPLARMPGEIPAIESECQPEPQGH